LNEYIEKNSLVEKHLGIVDIIDEQEHELSFNSYNRKHSFSSHDNKSSYRFSFMNGKNNRISLNEENNILDCDEKIDLFSDQHQ
jgi:hypothetical protein